MKAMRRTANITSSAIMEPFDQGTVVPPFWRAKKRQIIEAIRMNEPGRSSCNSFSLRVAGCGRAALGVWKKMKTKPAATPPTGRLM